MVRRAHGTLSESEARLTGCYPAAARIHFSPPARRRSFPAVSDQPKEKSPSVSASSILPSPSARSGLPRMRLARTARGFARGARGLAYASALAAASQGARADFEGRARHGPRPKARHQRLYQVRMAGRETQPEASEPEKFAERPQDQHWHPAQPRGQPHHRAWQAGKHPDHQPSQIRPARRRLLQPRTLPRWATIPSTRSRTTRSGNGSLTPCGISLLRRAFSWRASTWILPRGRC